MLAFLVALALLSTGCSLILPTSDDLAGGEGGNSGTSAGCLGTHGPEMVNVGSYCIDSTEVTAEQYAAFLDAAVDPADSPEPGCRSGNQYQPLTWPPDLGIDTRPVANVDWCDAVGFCAYAGKRLCGGVGGALIDSNDYVEPNPEIDEWYGACTNGGLTTSRSGDGDVSGVCNREVGAELEPVRSFAGCRGLGVYENVYDLGGNVAEWVNICTDSDYCRINGGYFGFGAGECSTGTIQQKFDVGDTWGFRCCADRSP